MSRRKRNVNGAHGLYFHSSVPKVYPNIDDFGKIQYEFTKNIASKTNALVIKPSNIRIWIHDKDIDKLMKVVLEGHGQKLRQEISSNTKVKRFLEYVPHFLGLIKSIHTAVIENNIELLRAKTSPPVPPQMLSCKDANGLTPLHKAAGLAHTKILEYLLEVWPNAVQEVDNSGKSPLHYAAATKNNERAFNLLVQAGADEMAMDGRGKMPSYYKKIKNSEEIDRNLLTIIPDAPRIAEQGFPSNFTWDILPAKFYEAPLRVAHSELNLSNSANDVGLKPSVSSFEIISRRESINNNGEEEIHEEEVIKSKTKKLDRPKSFTKRDVNNNSAKNEPEPVEENDDDDVETVQTAEAETLLPTKTENIDDSNENRVDNDEQDYPNETDNNVVNDSNDVDIENVLEQEQENVDASLANHEENGDNNKEEEEDQEQENNEENAAEEENQEDESMTIVNNNDDSAYETNGNEIVSRIQSSDTNNDEEDNESETNNVDQETGETHEEEIMPLEVLIEHKADILIIDSNEHSDDSNSNKIDEDEENALSENEIENDKEVQVIETVEIVEYIIQEGPSAENPRETGDSTVENLKEDENMSEGEDGEDDEEEEENDVSSPSPPFEGVIREEPEKQNESQGGEFEKQNEENEPEQEDGIQKIINSGDMEQLAALVLDGNGKKLVGRISKQPDIQAFLENVPIYMSKIRKVHTAAREGSLRDLQAALDRRKFSTAKDEISAKGTSPLHVAIIFGHTAIIRYLGSRFPETLQAVDEDNRTALHYAATIKDNGHFYNLLVTLGANPKALDNFGKTAEFYLNHDESDKILSHKDLLRNFGAAEELADEMLNDQEFRSNQPIEVPLFRTEEGRYLATSLGDPLIKGLTEVANLRPSDPVQFLANYLQNFSNDSKPKTSTIKQKREVPIKEVEKPKTQTRPPSRPSSRPVQNHFVSTNHVPSAKKLQMAKEKNVENFIDDDDFDTTPGMDERDEHGQSMLHFAAARQHGKNALFQLIEESGVSLTYRDEIYRTARDVSLQASQPDNCKEIDRYVLSLAARGDYETFVTMLLDGYDHIIDVNDNDGVSIAQVAKARGHHELAAFLDQLRDFEENREKLLFAIRHDDLETVKEILSRNDAAKLARAKNYYGRCSLHVAVLVENEEIVEFIADNFRQTLRVGDNLERTALHYSMGINNVEAISRILIKNGAKRVLKDLKGRTASFYYINKGDIARLQEEERLGDSVEQ